MSLEYEPSLAPPTAERWRDNFKRFFGRLLERQLAASTRRKRSRAACIALPVRPASPYDTAYNMMRPAHDRAMRQWPSVAAHLLLEDAQAQRAMPYSLAIGLPSSQQLCPLTLNPLPSFFNPKPPTLNPQPSTLKPQPPTLRPKKGGVGEG